MYRNFPEGWGLISAQVLVPRNSSGSVETV